MCQSVVENWLPHATRNHKEPRAISPVHTARTQYAIKMNSNSIRQRVAIRGLLDEPEPESAIGLNGLIEESFDFLSFKIFLCIGLHALDTLPALHAIAIEKPPHAIDREAHAQNLLIQEQRPCQMARENQHDDE